MSKPIFVNWELIPAGANAGTGMAPLATDSVLIDRRVQAGAQARVVACFTDMPWDVLQSFCDTNTAQVHDGMSRGSLSYIVFRVGVTTDAAKVLLYRAGLFPQA